MPDCRDNDRVLIFVEDHAPVSDPEPEAMSSPKTLHVTMPGLSKYSQPFIDPVTNIGR